jgi:hypothetical protein
LSYKKDALKALVTLYTGELFSIPTLDNEKQAKFLKDRKDVSKNKVRKEIKKKMKKKKKEDSDA